MLQPYIPEYRVSFFQESRALLRDKGFELVLAASRAGGRLAERGDDRTDLVADKVLTSRIVRVGGKPLVIRDLKRVLKEVQPDLVVAEQAIKNLDTYSLLVRQTVKGSPRLGLWGQGRAFSTPQGRAGSFVKRQVTLLSDWFFAYTEQGADFMVQHGMRRERVTVLNNTLDTARLRLDLEAVRPEAIEEFRRRHSLVPGRTALFLGGVDPSKGIDFLLEVADKVAEQIPGFRLVIAGMGSSANQVRHRQSQGDPIAYVGRLEGADKAVALRTADILMIPEWVGLVAVDSLVAGCPIVTTVHPSHSPEFSYLSDRSNAFVFAHDLDAYSGGVVQVMKDPQLLSRVAHQALLNSYEFSMSRMVERFAEGVSSWWTSRASH